MPMILAQEPEFTVRYLERLENATAEEQQAAFDLFGEVELPSILTVDGNVARIEISGPLSPVGPSVLARFFGFGGTSYQDIINAVQEVSEDDSITEVRFPTNTPGGTVTMVDETRQAIANLAKTKRVIFENHGMIASAGMWLASAAHEIIAMSPTVETGSIGVKIVGLDMTGFYKEHGVKKVTILSRNAPNKSAGLDTKDGRDELQRQVDAIERIFISRVAEGRGVSEQTVIEKFGKGGLLVAQDPGEGYPDAISVGLIDRIAEGLEAKAVTAENDDVTSKNAGPTTFRDFPIVDRPWDSAAADKRVRDFLNITDTPNNRYRQAFFWFDAENSENFGAYKLPFVDIVNGRMTAIKNAVSAADGAMSGARGNRVQIPAGDRAAVQRHIDRYKAKWQRQKGGQASAISTSQESNIMSLKTLLAENPGAQAEFDAAIKAARDEGVTAGASSVNERIEAAKPYLAAESTYPAAIRALATRVVAGEVDNTALTAAVAAYDATNEHKNSQAAGAESDAHGDTQAQEHAQGSASGVTETNEDFDAAIAAERKSRGLGE